MGTSVSRQPRTRLPPEALEHMTLYRTLGLQEKHVEKLFKAFSQIDKDGSGELSLFELLDHLKVSRTPFTQRVFSIFDEDGSGSVDFREFVLSTWNYATLTKSTLIMFAFDLYDSDGSGSIEFNEMSTMCEDVYGEGFRKSRLAVQILDKIHKMNDPSRGLGGITLDRFAVFCDHHPGLLYPAFSFQQALQKAILGSAFWDRLAEERLVMANGVQISIKEILTSHIDERKFKELCIHDDPESDALLPERMQREARKTLLQRSSTAEFREIYNATGTVSRRRTTQAALKGATTKLTAARAIGSSQSSAARRKTDTALKHRRPSKLRQAPQREAGQAGATARSNSNISVQSQPRLKASASTSVLERGNAAQGGALHARRNTTIQKLRIEPVNGARARPVL